MADTVLLVFEGAKTEPSIFDQVKRTFFRKRDAKRMVYAIFGTNILKLWRELKDASSFDTVEMLRDIAINKDKLKTITRDNVSEIHLFFDFEGHIPSVPLDEHCNAVCDMLEYFNEETEHGKLWISYPMSESLRHMHKDPNKCFDCIQNIEDNPKYKRKVGKFIDFQDVRHYNHSDWHFIIAANTLKVLCLVNRDCSLPRYADASSDLDQSRIFKAQKERFISLTPSAVVVLPSFPFFLLYYFGEELYNKIDFDGFKKGCAFGHIASGLRRIADA
jgi:hypothetical protein